MVTGATAGIGRECVHLLAQRGFGIVVGARDLNRAAALRDEVRRTSPTAEVLCLPLDLGDLGSVRRFAAEVLAGTPRFDGLLLCAAVVTPHREVTIDGLERQFGVNHLAHLLLARELLPALRVAAPSVVVFVSSLASLNAEIDFDDLLNTRQYDRGVAYARSKLANVMSARALGERETDTGVTVLSTHPGVVRTMLLDRLHGTDERPSTWLGAGIAAVRGVAGWLRRSMRRRAQVPWWDEPEVAAERLVKLLTEPLPPGASGAFIVDGRPHSVAPQARDAAAVERLWTASEQLLASAGGARDS